MCITWLIANKGRERSEVLCSQKSGHTECVWYDGRRQKDLVTPALFEMAMSGNADGIYSVLEDGDSVKPQVTFWSYFQCLSVITVAVVVSEDKVLPES